MIEVLPKFPRRSTNQESQSATLLEGYPISFDWRSFDKKTHVPRDSNLSPNSVSVLIVPVLAKDPRDNIEKIGVVLLRRKSRFGDGLLAFPGGVVREGEDLTCAGEKRLKEKSSIVLPEGTKINPYDVKSVQNGKFLVVYGITDLIAEKDLSPFIENAKASERVIAFAPTELAFATHTEIMHRFFRESCTSDLLKSQTNSKRIATTGNDTDVSFAIEPATPPMSLDRLLISDVRIKPLVNYFDDRGFFREIAKLTEGISSGQRFAQMSHSHMTQNVVKAWHVHHRQYDWWYVAKGKIEAVLFDNRIESPTFGQKFSFLMGETSKYGRDVHEVCVCIPPGVLHGLRVLSKEADLVYLTSQTYDPNDEGRLPFDDSFARHDWGPNPIVSPKDMTFIAPLHRRVNEAGEFE